ncbi:hypothetical protein HPB51_000310 [Rhipicephalus microplus]|uniref:Tick transposon n=1 Tax=Rhipicephalus microplus TaxID=6941 RepID=A0A9J6D3H7_RHIMP|nr:hypothetical protein HPB51_000310 [Rhipicephalus microplus]
MRTVRSITKLLGRIAHRRKGMREADTLRLVHAFVVSRIPYAPTYQATHRTVIEQAHRLLQTACKAALGRPQNTSTTAPSQLEMLNTYEEYATATLLTHRERLNTPPQERVMRSFQRL